MPSGSREVVVGFTEAQANLLYRRLAVAVPWADISGEPDTLAGYGITDAYTKVQADARYDPIATSGNFVPSLTFGGASVGMTYQTRVGKYMKQGNVVFFFIVVSLTAKGTSVGQAKVGGLPFACAAEPHAAISGRVSEISHTGSLQFFVLAGGTDCWIESVAVGGVVTQLANGQFTNSSEAMLTGFYIAA